MRLQLALNVRNLDEALEYYSKLFDQADITSASERLKAAGMADRVEDQQTCCYATQNKVWSVDPQGTRWEWYRVLEDSGTFGPSTRPGERRSR